MILEICKGVFCCADCPSVTLHFLSYDYSGREERDDVFGGAYGKIKAILGVE